MQVRKLGSLLAVAGVAAVLMLSAVAGCSDDRPDGGTSTTGTPTTAGPTTTLAGPPVMTVQDAVKVTDGTLVRVVGALIVNHDDASMVLTSALAESYPPVAGGPTIAVTGLDLDDLVGLSSTVGQTDAAPATWSDYWMVLTGIVTAGVFDVQTTPGIIRAITPELRLRFSAVSEPLRSDEVEWFAFDVRNDSAGDVELTFPNGQTAEITLSQGGAEKYRWSEGTLFTESIATIVLAPGQSHHVILNDDLDVPPGTYEMKAWFTASATAAGGEIQFPALEGTVEIH